jgi:hypothetical protein
MANVTGPGSSTDTAIARWNGTTGTVIQDSTVTIDGSGNMTGVASLAGSVTTTTQSQGNNSTKIATTAYVDTGLAGLSLNSLTNVIVDGNGNIFLGNNSGTATTSGQNNTALGSNTLANNTTGGSNMAFGIGSMVSNTTGNDNTALGCGALVNNATGSDNTVVGNQALQSSTGSNNTALGSVTGQTVGTGSNNILIGYNADVPTGSTSNYLNIGGVITGDMTTGPALKNGFTATTQSAGDNSTKIATTAYVDAAAGAGIITVSQQVFTASGTYTPSAGMVYCIAEAVGGGGGGGGASGNTAECGSGGGGGEYARVLLTAAQVGASKSVTIGAAGAAGNNSGGNGGAGVLGFTVHREWRQRWKRGFGLSQCRNIYRRRNGWHGRHHDDRRGDVENERK